MPEITVRDLAQRLGGELRLVGASPKVITGFATDSRDVRAGDLFLAIRGAQVDGHAYVVDAFEHGAVAALVERGVSGNHILVPNIVSALARMARSYRHEFQGSVIGITGSAGKSSTKEFLAAALEAGVLKTEGNRNTEYTAPLLWAEVSDQHRFVVVEMGMRGPGQIAHLASFTEPTIGIITNIGVAHLSELGSRENIAAAKGELIEALPEEGTAVLWAEDDFLGPLTKLAGKRRVLTFGFSDSADLRIESYRAASWTEAEVLFRYGDAPLEAKLPVVGRHFALNAAAALLAAISAGEDPATAAHAMKNAQLPPMRMMVREQGDTTFVLDMYNSSPPAVSGALETVRDVMGNSERLVVVLGEMRELGEQSESGHREVGASLPGFGVHDAILLAANPDHPAPYVAQLREAAIEAGMPASNIRIASSHDEVKAYLSELAGPHVVLVKGSRAVELERALPEGIL